MGLTMKFTKGGSLTQLLLLITLLGLIVAVGESQQTAVPNKPQPDATPSDIEKRRAAFELVWQTVDKNFYDPNFNGVNWKAIHDRYAPLIARTTTDQELYLLLQQMVNELHQSHFWIIPPQSIPELSSDEGDQEGNIDEPDKNLEAVTPLDRIRRKLSERLSTGIGIDLRILDGLAVISRVEPGSPAARAGLRSGFVIKSVNGRPLAQTITQIEQNPIFHEIIRPEVPLILVAQYINGDLRDPVQLTYVNGRNLQRNVTIKREKLNGEMSPAIGNLPPLFTEFESRRLAGGLGYIRFNAFVPTTMKKICAALRRMHDERGIIIDLRGNLGGLLGMIGGLGGLVEEMPTSLGSMKTRTGLSPVFAFPQRAPYRGELAILVDSSTQSAAEIFAAGMQETKRGIVVGDISAGNTLPSGIVKLPTGALFQYAFGNYQTPSGIFLEGRGVIPDLMVRVNRRALLVGGDPQLTAAIRKLRERAGLATRQIPPVTVTIRAPEVKKTGADKNDEASIEPPPPPPPMPAVNKDKSEAGDQTKQPRDPAVPSTEQIIKRYIESLGGETALRKITSRVSKGTIELNSVALSGTVDVYEQAPNRSSVVMNLKGFGLVQQTFNGSARWLHDPLQGYIKLPAVVPGAKDEFHAELELQRFAGSLRFEGKEKVGQRDCFVLKRTAGGAIIKYYFDVESGLLLRENSAYYEDYRDVDGMKIPFVVRQEGLFGDVLIRLSEVKHNAPIDEREFAEREDCFTKPEQYSHP